MEELAAKISVLLKDTPWPEAERILAMASHNVKVREATQALPIEEPAPRKAGRSPFASRDKSGDYLGEN